MTKPRSKSRSKSKSKSRKSKPKQKKSIPKTTWEKFLNHKDSRKALSKSWKSKNPQEYYNKTIRKLSKKYSTQK